MIVAMARGVEGRALVVDLDAKRRCVAEGRLEAGIERRCALS